MSQMTNEQKILKALGADKMSQHDLGVAAKTAAMCGQPILAADLYALQAAKTGPRGEDLETHGRFTATGFQPVIGPEVTLSHTI